MKILFICGSLEPGKDGVGDYSRMLASELIKNKYQVALLSLFDKGIDIDLRDFQVQNEVKLLCYRITDSINFKQRIKLYDTFLKEFQPDWCSLQFVPYAYNPKGLPFKLIDVLRSSKVKVKWHIMFHELWIGMNSKSSLKESAIGKIQQHIIFKLIKNLKSNVITTHSQIYQLQLSRQGVTSEILPLFGNIPILEQLLSKKSKILRFVLFGAIHRGADIEGFVKWIKRESKAYDEIYVEFIGNNGAEGYRWGDCLNDSGIKIINHGFQDTQSISKILLNANIGVTTTPYILTEKSGSVAAMLEHNLPIICVAREWQTIRKLNAKIKILPVLEWSEGLTIADILNFKVKSNNLTAIAQQFENLLTD